MGLFLEQSKSRLYGDQANGFALEAEFSFMSRVHRLHKVIRTVKTLKGKRECVFRGEVKKTLIPVCEILINPLVLIVLREDVLSALNNLELSRQILWLPYPVGISLLKVNNKH